MELFSLPIFPYNHAPSPNLHATARGERSKIYFAIQGRSTSPREKKWERKGKKKGKGNKTTGRRIGNPIIDECR